jgi:phosphopantetheine adenylyltransferase
MQLEAAHAVELTKMVEYAERRKIHLYRLPEQTNTTLTQHSYRQIDASRQTYQGQQSIENIREMAREGDAWTIST